MLLDTQYYLFFLLVRTQTHQVFRHVSRPHTAVHVRSMDFSNLDHTLVEISRGGKGDSHVDSDIPLVSKVKCEKIICAKLVKIGMQGNTGYIT